jgi:hypothetical protein
MQVRQAGIEYLMKPGKYLTSKFLLVIIFLHLLRNIKFLLCIKFLIKSGKINREYTEGVAGSLSCYIFYP